MSSRQTPWLCTYTGKRVDVFNPTPDSVDIVDIVYALNRKYRFTGHMNWTVLAHTVVGCLHLLDHPVFRHTCWGFAPTTLVAEADPITWEQLRKYSRANPSLLFPCRLFLMHDMTEAYLPDVNSLLKPWCRITNPDDHGDSVSFSDLENSLYPVIFYALISDKRWGFWPKPWNRILELCKGTQYVSLVKSLDLALCRTEAEVIGEFSSEVIREGNFGDTIVPGVRDMLSCLPYLRASTRRAMIPALLPMSETRWWHSDLSTNNPSTPNPYQTFEPVYLFWLLLYCLFPYCSFWQTESGQHVEAHLQRMLPDYAGLHHLTNAVQ